MTALMWAAMQGDTGEVTYLLNVGAEVNAKNIYGETALILAALQGYTEIVTALMDAAYIKVNAADLDGNMPLMLAAKYGPRRR